MKKLKINIDHQGAPVIEHGVVLASGKNVVALAIQMKSKYCEVSSDVLDGDIPVLLLGTTEESYLLKKHVYKK